MPWAPDDRSRSARGALVESPVVELDVELSLDSRDAGDQVPQGRGALGLVGRLFGVELDNPPRRVPCSVFLHESGRYPRIASEAVRRMKE